VKGAQNSVASGNDDVRALLFELRTERLLLRDFLASDFEFVHAYASDPEVVRYMDWGPNTEADTRAFLERSLAPSTAEQRTNFELAVIDTHSNTLLGGAGLHVDASGIQAMIGYCFARAAWGRGIATEASAALVQFGFHDLGLHRIWAGCDSENHRSRRVLEKLGMRQEGHLRENVFVRSAFRDTLLFAVLQQEWQPPSTG
jgi:RimJ/RimL family protein N-acetyltransferase